MVIVSVSVIHEPMVWVYVMVCVPTPATLGEKYYS